jgi:hypothetical protein
MDEIMLPAAIEPTEWFVVFRNISVNYWLDLLTPGQRKHVSAFGYCPGVKLWLVYDVQLSGTRIILMSQAEVLTWVGHDELIKIARVGKRMGLSSRLGFSCVNAVKHLIGLRCVAATPDALHYHILRNGGILISDARQPAPAAARSSARAGAAAGTG